MTRSLSLTEAKRCHDFRKAADGVFTAIDRGDKEMLSKCLENLIRSDSGLFRPSKQLWNIGKDVEFYLHRSDAMINGEGISRLIELTLAAQKPVFYFQFRHPSAAQLIFNTLLLIPAAIGLILMLSPPSDSVKYVALTATASYGLFLCLVAPGD